MATATSIYQKWSDNVSPNATWSIETGTDPADTNYVASNLGDGSPAKVAKINSTTAAWLADFGTAQRIDIAALIHHNFDAGADVKIQGNATNSWGAPTFSMSFTIPTWLATGTTRRWPVNAWLDLTTSGSYSATGFRYWRIVITSNSQNVQLGEVWLSATIRRFTKNLQWGLRRRVTSPIIEHKTAFLSTTQYWRGTFQRRWDAQVNPNDSLQSTLFDQFHDQGGRAYPWLFILDGTVNDAAFVRWLTTEQEMQAIFVNGWSMPVSIEEVGRGLRPGN